MTTKTRKVTEAQATKVLNAVAAWLGTKGYGTPICPEGRELQGAFDHVDDGTFCEKVRIGPAPTGEDAARKGEGPMLMMGFDWGSKPTPTVVLEGGPYEWAIECSWEIQKAMDAARVPVFVEPYAGWALSIWRN